MARGVHRSRSTRTKTEPPSKSYGHFTHTHTHIQGGGTTEVAGSGWWSLFDFCLSYYKTGNCINTANTARGTTATPPAYKFN